jgi:hypothetical protein
MRSAPFSAAARTALAVVSRSGSPQVIKLVRYIKWFIIGIALGKGFGACIAFFQ